MKAMSILLRLFALLPADEVEGLITPDLAADREMGRKIAQRHAEAALADAAYADADAHADDKANDD